MAAKKKRLEILRELLQNNTFESQEEMLNALSQAGFPVAQPTLSRDLRTLKVSKMFTEDGGYAYAIPTSNHVGDPNPAVMPRSYGFMSVDFSGNIAVFKTVGGYASMLASKIDSYNSKEVIGTVAGDDTVIAVLREGTPKSIIHNLLKAIIPHYGEQ